MVKDMPDPLPDKIFDQSLISAEQIVEARPFEMVEGMPSNPAIDKVLAVIRTDLAENIMVSNTEYAPLRPEGVALPGNRYYADQMRDYEDTLGNFDIPVEVIAAQFDADMEDIQTRLNGLLVKGPAMAERLPPAHVDHVEVLNAIDTIKHVLRAKPTLLESHSERVRLSDAAELLMTVGQRLEGPDDPPHYRPSGNGDKIR
jgi:hypothetical protein